MLGRALAIASIAALAASAHPTGAAAASKSSAQRAAREAAQSYATQRWGIGGTARDWKATCSRSRGSSTWSCRLSGPCSGSLKLRERANGRFSAYGQRMHCGD